MADVIKFSAGMSPMTSLAFPDLCLFALLAPWFDPQNTSDELFDLYCDTLTKLTGGK